MRHGHFLLYADPGAEDEAVAEERACRVDTPRRASIYRGTTPQCAQLLELDGRPTASGTARSQQDDEDEDLHVLRPWGMDTASPSASPPQTAGAAPLELCRGLARHGRRASCRQQRGLSGLLRLLTSPRPAVAIGE